MCTRNAPLPRSALPAAKAAIGSDSPRTATHFCTDGKLVTQNLHEAIALRILAPSVSGRLEADESNRPSVGIISGVDSMPCAWTEAART